MWGPRGAGVGPSESPMWDLRRHWCVRGGGVGPSDVSVWTVVPLQSPVKTFKGIVVRVLTPQRHMHGGKGSSRDQQGPAEAFRSHVGSWRPAWYSQASLGALRVTSVGPTELQVGSRQMRLCKTFRGASVGPSEGAAYVGP